MNIYQANGFESRRDYMEHLADENGVELSHVLAMADMLGPDEDFDGLVTMVEDMNNDY